MNPAQESIARNFIAKVKKALKDAQTGLGTAPMSRSGNSSSGQATIALTAAQVYSKTKRLHVEGSVDLTGEKGKRKYNPPPSSWKGLSSKTLLFNSPGMSLLTSRVWIA